MRFGRLLTCGVCIMVLSLTAKSFLKVKVCFYVSLPVGASQSEGFQAAATDWPLETLHAEQQNGRPSTD